MLNKNFAIERKRCVNNSKQHTLWLITYVHVRLESNWRFFDTKCRQMQFLTCNSSPPSKLYYLYKDALYAIYIDTYNNMI